MKNNKPKMDDNQKESRRILDRVEVDSETVGTSSFARTANKTRDHFLGKDIKKDDPVELWGTRIGRILSLIIVIGLAYYLYNTYLK